MLRHAAVLLLAVLSSAQPFVPYTCRKSLPEAMREFEGVHPFHETYSQGGFLIATQLAVWVRSVLDETEASMPLKYAYYANMDDSTEVCMEAEAKPYFKGGGQPLCHMLQWESGVANKQLGYYFQRVMDLGCASRSAGCIFTSPREDWENAKQLVYTFGFTAYDAFLKTWTASCPHGMYNPNGECHTIQEYEQMNKNGDTPYYGLSGGGGGGTGYEVFCVNKYTRNETTLLSGGGGGGGGVNTPEQCHPIEAGGGGGGGVEIYDGTPEIGAGVGNHDLFIGTSADISPEGFAVRMKRAADSMKQCKAEGNIVALRGGGGGGAGFEAYEPYNMSDCNANQPEREPNVLSVGYGYQFAMGVETKLVPDAGVTEKVYVSCPVGDGSCEHCVDNWLHTSANITHKGISQVFKCAQQLSNHICKKAATPDGRPYGQYEHYTTCNCPVARMYKYEYLPPAPEWKYDRTGRCVFLFPPPAPGDYFPEITRKDIEAHPEWCRKFLGCKPLPGCPN